MLPALRPPPPGGSNAASRMLLLLSLTVVVVVILVSFLVGYRSSTARGASVGGRLAAWRPYRIMETAGFRVFWQLPPVPCGSMPSYWASMISCLHPQLGSDLTVSKVSRFSPTT